MKGSKGVEGATRTSALTRRMVVGGSVAGAVAGLGAVAGSAEAAPEWTDRDKSIMKMTSDPIVGVRWGAHPTYERLVIDFRGPTPGGAWVGYTEAFWSMGTGSPYLVAGVANLLLFVRGPSGLGIGGGQVMTRKDQFEAAGLRTFQDLVFGGTLPDFNWSAFGLGVAARRGFRLFQLGPDTAGHSRLVLDVLR